MLRLKVTKTVCAICGKGASVGYYRSHSHHRVKRVVKPNLQWLTLGDTRVKVCTRCRRTLLHKK